MKGFVAKYSPYLLIISGLSLLIVSFGPIAYSEIWYFLKQQRKQDFTVQLTSNSPNGPKSNSEESVFSRFLSGKNIIETPASTEFGIVIEKIGVNAPVVSGVSVTNPDSYNEALKNGVAQAISSDNPSTDPGNTYLFAHASLNFWELGKYATTFNLLRKLETNDLIRIIYKQKIYTYYVVNIEVHEGWNTSPITRAVIEPILTLQTCDPPGTTLNRLVVTAKLRDVQDL